MTIGLVEMGDVSIGIGHHDTVVDTIENQFIHFQLPAQPGFRLAATSNAFPGPVNGSGGPGA